MRSGVRVGPRYATDSITSYHFYSLPAAAAAAAAAAVRVTETERTKNKFQNVLLFGGSRRGSVWSGRGCSTER